MDTFEDGIGVVVSGAFFDMLVEHVTSLAVNYGRMAVAGWLPFVKEVHVNLHGEMDIPSALNRAEREEKRR